MDTRVTHLSHYGIVMGQWWRHKSSGNRRRIRWLTERGMVRMDMPPKMLADTFITIQQLLQNYVLDTPVKVRPYTQPDGIIRYQVFELEFDRRKQRIIKYCIGELKNV